MLLIPGILATLMILPPLLPSSLTQFNLVWIFLFHLPISLAKSSPKWFNSQCAKAVKHKNHRFKQWKLHQTPHSRALSVQAHNLCSKAINHAKTSFVNCINNKIALCQTGSRSFWSLAKVVSQNFCHFSFPPLKTNSGSSSCTPSSKANLFASTFASNSNLDDQESPPPLYPTSTLAMCPIKFSTRKVRKALLQLNTSKSSGPDGIPAMVPKSCSPELALVLNKLFQLSYNRAIFPSSWKLADVAPIPKKGDKSDPSNYCPIAITSLISTTMETIVTKQLLAFLETYNFLSDHQYGFRQARSTGDLLAYAVHAWSSALESYGESRVISLDISKAFDRVWHKGLLAKLPMFGLNHTLITCIFSFLSDRSIAIRVDGYLSKPHSINSGVPQGSVISPALFILFINDVLSSTSSSIFSIADDTYLSSSFSSSPQHFAYSNTSPYRNTSASLLTNDLTNVEKWGDGNLATFNQEKTTKVVISRKHLQDFSPVLMNGHKLDISSSFTQLGLSVSSNLTWKPHIISIAKHASQKLGFLSRARGYFSPSQLLTKYKSMIRPSLEYCSHVWGGAPKSSLKLLDRAQSKAIRLINNPNLTNSVQSLSHRRLVADLSVFYHYFHGHCSQEIKNIIPDPIRHVRTTRGSTHSHPFQVTLPNPRTLAHKSSFIPRTSQLWNSLPPTSFPESFNLSSFKSNVNKLDLVSLST